MTELSVLHVICPEPADARGGADLHVRDLAACQHQRGVRVSVLVLRDDSFARSVAAAGCPAAAVSIRRAPASIASFLRGGSDRHARIVHSHGYEADYVATAGRLLAGAGHIVMTAHGFLRIDLRMRVMTAANLLCLRCASGIITAGARLAEDLRSRFRFVEHIPNGTPAPRRIPATRLGARARLGLVGRLSPEKRPQLALDVARQLVERGIDVETHIFGGGPMLEDIRSAARSGRYGRVVVEGFVEDVDAIFERIDLLIVPSEVESSPRVVLEAMAREVAVVACAVGDIPTILDHGRCGVVACADSVTDLVNGCERLFRDVAHRASVARWARERWEERYRLEAMADRVEDLYSRVALTRA